jgi:hypothetical protein
MLSAIRLSMLVVLLAAASPAWAGWVIDQELKHTAGSQKQRLFMQANRLKSVVLDGERTTMAVVMDLDAQTITQIDYQQRAYTTATAKEYAEMMRQGMQEMGQAMGQMQSQMKEIEAQLKDLPPEQRKQIEAMMRQMQQPQGGGQAAGAAANCTPDRVDVRRSGKNATIAGYAATGYEVLSNGVPDSEVFIAPAITAAREIDPQKLERMMREMLQAMPHCPPRGQMSGADPAWKLMKEGYPVRTVEKDGRGAVEVVKAESRAIAAGEFQPPAGFAKKSLRELMGGK